MPLPTLLTIEEDTNKLRRLQEENEALKRLSENVKTDNVLDVNPGPVPQHPPLMDDFYIIAQ